MRILFAVVAGLLSLQAEAKVYRAYNPIHFNADQSLYVDELNLGSSRVPIPDGYTDLAYGVSFEISKSEGYSIEGKFVSNELNDPSECNYKIRQTPIGDGFTQVMIDFLGQPKLDSGAECIYTIDINGRKAIITLLSQIDG